MPSDWGEWPMPSPYELLLRLQRHVGAIEGRQDAESRETRRHLTAQDQSLREIKDEVAELKRRPSVRLVDPPRPAPTRMRHVLREVRSFLGAVASPREWTFGAILVMLALTGIIEPALLIRSLFAAIGLAPI
jgi:hypothetical protein